MRNTYWLLILRFLALLAFCVAFGCKPQPESISPSAALEKPTNAYTAETTSNELNEFLASLPKVGGPEGYTGSESCRSCHPNEHESWHRSYHRTMTQIASPESVQATFHNVVMTNDGTRYTLSQKSNEFWVRMESLAPVAPGEERPSLDVRMGLVTGSHHMQVFWLPGGEGNLQIGFPFTWLIPEKKWVPRETTFVRPPDASHRTEVWNVICSRCHATAIQPRVDSISRTVDTRAAELGISCEACHGPGQRHVDSRRLGQNSSEPISQAVIQAEIVHPGNLDPSRASQICGFCHSMKWIDKSEPWRQHGFSFRPGQDLEASTPIIRKSQVDTVPALARYLERNPDLLEDFFWPDGMIRVSGREYNGLIESPCYKGNQFSCLSCHSMHKSNPDDQLANAKTGNGACLQCHETFREENRLIAHTRHSATSSGSECYNCHMPHTTYGVLKAIRSHQVSSPKIDDHLASGRPNACNLCHLDKTLNWTANHLADWYGHPRYKGGGELATRQDPANKTQLPEGADNVSEAVRLALAGDAGQRVLMAWHFSWQPALQISGTNWIPPHLGQLMDDSYAAVRCVAERSLKAISKLTPGGYDYIQQPQDRKPIRDVVWSNWQKQLSSAKIRETYQPEVLIRPGDLNSQLESFDKLLNLRNEKNVRLRE